jgi:hypothetical protein
LDFKLCLQEVRAQLAVERWELTMRDEEGAILKEFVIRLLPLQECQVGVCPSFRMPGFGMAGCRGVKLWLRWTRKKVAQFQYQRYEENLWELRELSTASTLRLLVHIMGRAPPLLTFNALEHPLTCLCFDVNSNFFLDTMTTYPGPPLCGSISQSCSTTINPSHDGYHPKGQ